MTQDLASRLRDALAAADFTYDAVADLLGPLAHDALARNETTPGLRATRGGSPLETLTRLFLLQTPVDHADAERALPGLVDVMANEGLIEQSLSEVAARLDVRPYAAPHDEDPGNLWIVSDLTPGMDGSPNRVRSDYVLGISPASTNLAQQTLRDPVGSALDLGTGCGVQAVHLARHAERVVATDVNARALWMTRFNAELNGIPLGTEGGIDVRDGSFFEPVATETFDLIATNPPFVISPATGERLVYRDSGLPGDAVVEHIVRSAPDRLNPGGWCQILANWVIRDDQPWDERLAGWVGPDSDAFVIQREVLDPAAYVELWLKDSGHHGGPEYLRRYDTWLDWLEREGVAGVGFGWINLRRTETDRAPRTEFLEWPYEVEQPVAPAIGAWAQAQDFLAGVEDLAGERLVVRSDVQQETQGAPGAEDPEAIVLRQQRGFRRARRADTVEAAVVGACDGDLALGQIADAVAQILDRDAGEVRAEVLGQARELLAEGFLEPADA